MELLVQNKNFYVYRHIRLDTNTPFYIGKGTKDRAFRKDSRNQYWENIVNLAGYEVEIILDNLTEEQAFAKELEFTKIYKDLGYCEANLVNGGGGSAGYKWTPEQRAKLSPIHRGRKHTEQALLNMSLAQTGKVRTEETKVKLAKAHTGKVLTTEHKLNIGKSVLGELNGFFGKTHSPETKVKMSLARKGKPSNRKGIKLSDQTKQKISDTKKGKRLCKV